MTEFEIESKKINPKWYYFLNFYFFITIALFLIFLVISIIFILPYISTVKEYISPVIDFIKNNQTEILDYLNDTFQENLVLLRLNTLFYKDFLGGGKGFDSLPNLPFF